LQLSFWFPLWKDRCFSTWSCFHGLSSE
jgi:hypothetical protein